MIPQEASDPEESFASGLSHLSAIRRLYCRKTRLNDAVDQRLAHFSKRRWKPAVRSLDETLPNRTDAAAILRGQASWLLP